MRKIVWALLVFGVAGCSAAADETSSRRSNNAQGGSGGSGTGGSAGQNQGGSSGAGTAGSGSGGAQTGGSGGSGNSGSGGSGTAGTGGAGVGGGGGAAGVGVGGSGGPAGAGGSGGNLPAGVHELDVGPFTLDGGAEETYCVDMPVSADGKGFDVSKFEGIITKGGHHMILYTTTLPPQTQPYKCSVFVSLFFAGTSMLPLFPSQQDETLMELPQGVAYHFPDSARVTVDFHYLNTGTTPLTASGKILMTEPAPGTVQQHSNLFFFGPAVSLSIPAGVNSWTGFYDFKQANPVSVFGATTHSHKWTVNTTLAFGTQGATTVQYTNTDWDQPLLQNYNPPISVPGSGGGLQLTCNYNNTTGANLVFGESAKTNEMCITWGYYYPDAGAIMNVGN